MMATTIMSSMRVKPLPGGFGEGEIGLCWGDNFGANKKIVQIGIDNHIIINNNVTEVTLL